MSVLGRAMARPDHRPPVVERNVPDALLKETMVRYGYPPHGLWWDDVNPNQGAYGRAFLRRCALLFYWDTRASERGDRSARDRVEGNRAMWEIQRVAREERLREEGPDAAPDV